MTSTDKHLSEPFYKKKWPFLTDLPAAQETPSERGHQRVPGGLPRVQLRWKLPVQCDQRGNHRRQRWESGPGQPEEVHPVWCGGAGQQQRWNGAFIDRGGCDNTGRWWVWAETRGRNGGGSGGGVSMLTQQNRSAEPSEDVCVFSLHLRVKQPDSILQRFVGICYNLVEIKWYC